LEIAFANLMILLVSFDGTIGRVSFGIEGCYSSGLRKTIQK